MKRIEKLLAAALLEMASEEFSNNCCNDYPIENFLNEEEIEDLHKDMEKWNRGEIITPKIDWLLMSYLAAKLVEEAQ